MAYFNMHSEAVRVFPEIEEQIRPYLLPENHAIKKKLDKLLADPNVLNNNRTLRKAGFNLSRSQKQVNHVKVATHQKLKGYLIKTYTNDQADCGNEMVPFLTRIINANLIKEAILRNNYTRYFKVPKKWIYLLPNATSTHRKCVLVVEDMLLYSDKNNKKIWKLKNWTEHILEPLFILLQEEGLVGSIYVDNISFSRKDGKIAFIDTEHAHVWPVPYEKLTKRLHLDLKVHWTNLSEGQ